MGSLPVLQDLPEVNVWESWGVVYRDVFVLNRCGEQVAVFNLTGSGDLRVESNYEHLRGLIIAAVESGE